jgi:phospho-N-acetylmuramoyl-pentapeptide-transferase
VVALLLAGGIAMAVALVATRFLIPALQRQGIGQPIRVEGPEGHHEKAGTPTMGGITIVSGAVLGYLLSHVRSGTIFTRGGITVMLAIIGAAGVGLLDDWIKVTRARNLGLNKRTKLFGLVGVAVVFAVLALQWANVKTQLSFTRFDSLGVDLGKIGWAVLAVLMILGAANAVNLTDGLDGLAAGSATYSFMAYVLIGFWAFRHESTYQIPQALDLAIAAAAMAGGCIGFLWWNAAPAQIFMGDTGSLAIGSGLAALALVTNTQLLLPVIGGLYVIETLSVILQVGSFRSTGRRVFRMAPVHHHFELGGWPETTVIVRLWILTGLFTALGLGIFYADFIALGGID